MVWGEKSVDAVLWQEDFGTGQRVDAVKIVWNPDKTLTPTGSWFRTPKGKHRFATYE